MSNAASCGKSKYEVDMTRGSILRHLVRFSGHHGVDEHPAAVI